MDIEKIKIIYDFQMKSLSETTNVLAKGMTFYLLILAAITGYIVSQDIPEEIKNRIFIIGIVTNIFALIAGIGLGYGIYKGIENVKKTLKILDKELWQVTEMEEYFNRGKRIVIIVSISCVSLLLFIMAYLIITRYY